MAPMPPNICAAPRQLLRPSVLRPSHVYVTRSRRAPAHALVAASSPAHASLRSYYTPAAPDLDPFSSAESAILSAAYAHVPEYGFSQAALLRGAHDAGYPPVSTSAFARGAFDLVLYHLVTERLALKHRIQFPTPLKQAGSTHADTPPPPPPSVTDKVRRLVLARLHANEPIIGKLPEALGLMSLAGNIPASLAELSRLVDEMWYLAGDQSVDNSWYTKRATLAAIYASSEAFMTQDKSPGFAETDGFVSRRLDDVRRAGYAAGSVTEWLGFTGTASVNVLRSWGMRV